MKFLIYILMTLEEKLYYYLMLLYFKDKLFRPINNTIEVQFYGGTISLSKGWNIIVFCLKKHCYSYVHPSFSIVKQTSLKFKISLPEAIYVVSCKQEHCIEYMLCKIISLNEIEILTNNRTKQILLLT